MKTHHDTQASFTDDELTGWFAGRIPDDLFAAPPTITGDRDEIGRASCRERVSYHV